MCSFHHFPLDCRSNQNSIYFQRGEGGSDSGHETLFWPPKLHFFWLELGPGLCGPQKRAYPVASLFCTWDAPKKSKQYNVNEA